MKSITAMPCPTAIFTTPRRRVAIGSRLKNVSSSASRSAITACVNGGKNEKLDMGSALHAAHCGGFFAHVSHPAVAQERFPNKPIRLIVPFNAGGAADIVARLIGQSVSEKLGQPVIVENRPARPVRSARSRWLAPSRTVTRY